MVNRSASSSLQGYYYQFDKTILEMLRLSSPTAHITVEGIEDFDIESSEGTEAVQCKYHAARRFSESSIREPVSLMLIDSLEREEPIRYHLYAYYQDSSSIDASFTAERLKRVLTRRVAGTAGLVGVNVPLHELYQLTDEQLASFARSFTFTIGPSFDAQHKEILRLLQEVFACNLDEADRYYYNNALRLIADTAVKPNQDQRTIVKQGFLSQIDDRAYLFNRWYVRLKEKDSYVRVVRTKLKQQALRTQRRVLVYLPESVCKTETPERPLGRVIQEVAEAWFRPGKSLYDAKPWTFVLDADGDRITQVKTYLLSQRIPFNDGYEAVEFSPTLFERPPFIYRQMTPSGTATQKIDQASYHLRILGEATYLAHIAELRCPDVIIDFSGDAHRSKLTPNGALTFRIANCGIPDLLAILS